MSANVNDKITKALGLLGEALHPDRAAVGACLRALNALLQSLEVSEAARVRFGHRVVDVLADNTRPTHREVVTAIEDALADCDEIHRSLGDRAAGAMRVRVTNTPVPQGGRWDLKELDNRLPRVRKDASVARPFLGNMRPASPQLPRWRRFDARPEDHARDHHATNLDRESVDRMLRGLGHGMKDFGPEPPMGGQPALR